MTANLWEQIGVSQHILTDRNMIDFDNGVEKGNGTYIDSTPSDPSGYHVLDRLEWIRNKQGQTVAFESREWPNIDPAIQQANNLTVTQDSSPGFTAVNANGWAIGGAGLWTGNSFATTVMGTAIDLNDQNQVAVQGKYVAGNLLEGTLWENQSSTTLRDTLPYWFQWQVLGIQPYSICNQVKPAPAPPLAPDATTDATIHILATAEDLTSNPPTPPIAGQLNTLWTRDNSGKWNYAEMALPTGTNITEIVTMNSNGVIAARGTTNSVSTLSHALLLVPVDVTIWNKANDGPPTGVRPNDGVIVTVLTPLRLALTALC